MVRSEPRAVHYVESGQLIVPWKQHKAFLSEEANAKRLREHNERHGFNNQNAPIVRALEQVFENTGDDKESPLAYADRQGEVRLPFDEACELGRRFFVPLSRRLS